MLYIPARHKPKFGHAGIIPGHPLTPDFFLALNEGGGNTVYDLITKKPCTVGGYTGVIPAWEGYGIEFDANNESIDAGLYNDILPANCDGTIFFSYRWTNTPASYYYFFTVGVSYTVLSAFISGNAITVYCDGTSTSSLDLGAGWESTKNIAITWLQNGANITFYFYLDGLLKVSRTITSAITATAMNLYIGGRYNSTARYAGGIYNNFYIKTKCLSGAEIASLSVNPYQWMYDRSEMLIRSVWAVAGGGGTVPLAVFYHHYRQIRA